MLKFYTAFYHITQDAIEEVIGETWGVACIIGRQIFPQINGPEGFYYAKLRKKAD